MRGPPPARGEDDGGRAAPAGPLEASRRWLAPAAVAVILVMAVASLASTAGAERLLAFPIAAPAILIAALWYPRLAMALAGAVLAPAALLALVVLVEPPRVEYRTAICYATSPPRARPPSASLVQVGDAELACLTSASANAHAREVDGRALNVIRAAVFGAVLAWLLMMCRWPGRIRYTLAAAPAGIVVVSVLLVATTPGT